MSKHNAPKTAAILVGGLGTRLRSVVPDSPKPMASINDRPFLAILLGFLATAGVKKTVLCTGYKGGTIEEYFGETFGAMQLVYSHEPEPLGTAGALRYAIDKFPQEEVLVLNGDSYCAFDVQSFFKWHGEMHAKASIVLTPLQDTGRYGTVEFDSDGHVTAFREKSPELGAGYINAGIYLIDHSIVESIPEGRPCSLERDIFPSLVSKALCGWPHGGRFIDIGVPEDYARAQHFFAAPD